MQAKKTPVRRGDLTGVSNTLSNLDRAEDDSLWEGNEPMSPYSIRLVGPVKVPLQLFYCNGSGKRVGFLRFIK
jgi:hypothetical protein